MEEIEITKPDTKKKGVPKKSTPKKGITKKTVTEAKSPRKTKASSSSSKELSVVEKKPLTVGRLSKTKTSSLRSIIGDSAEEIHQLIEVGDGDSATTLLHKRLMQTLIDLVPFAEHTIRKSKGRYGVYQINALVSQVRELLVDIQATQDRGQLGVNLVESIIRPSFQDIGMSIVQEFDTLSSDAKVRMEPDEWKSYRDVLQTARTRIGEVINKQYGSMREDCINFMQR